MCYPVLAPLSRGYPRLEGRLSTCYSPVRHSTRTPKDAFAFDLHVLGTPPAFVLSQDQTLQFESFASSPDKNQPAPPAIATVDTAQPGKRRLLLYGYKTVLTSMPLLLLEACRSSLADSLVKDLHRSTALFNKSVKRPMPEPKQPPRGIPTCGKTVPGSPAGTAPIQAPCPSRTNIYTCTASQGQGAIRGYCRKKAEE